MSMVLDFFYMTIATSPPSLTPNTSRGGVLDDFSMTTATSHPPLLALNVSRGKLFFLLVLLHITIYKLMYIYIGCDWLEPVAT
jgi:hypothetical protein